MKRELRKLSSTNRDSIMLWLIGENPSRLNNLSPTQRSMGEQSMDYRYRILRERYLGVGRERAYRNLIQRLSGIFLMNKRIKTWISFSRDRARSVVDVLKEVIQELVQQDAYLQQQNDWIGQCTKNGRLRNALMMATIEEYCLRPVSNQPLLMYRVVNYLRRSQHAGMTQVPAGDFIRMISEEFSVSLLDEQSFHQYQEEQAQQELGVDDLGYE